MISASPYLKFPGNTEEAFTYYKSVFGGEFTSVTRFRDMGDNPMGIAESDLDKIANIGLPLGKHTVLMGTDSLAGGSRSPWATISTSHSRWTARRRRTGCSTACRRVVRWKMPL